MAKVPCPCCGHLTLTSRGEYSICPVCFWEDDGQDDADAAVCQRGPNHVSLIDGRRSFLLHGFAEEKDRRHVRAPLPDEPRVRSFVIDGENVIELPARPSSTAGSGRRDGEQER